MRLVVFLGCFLFCSFSIATSFDDLVERDGVYYQKSSQVPYTGQIDGIEKGLIRDGKKEGLWITFFSDGRALSKAHFTNGIVAINSEIKGKWFKKMEKFLSLRKIKLL